MISTDFASNESASDALLSLALIFQPWRWFNGPQIQEATINIQSLCHPEQREGSSNQSVNLFLTGRAALYYYLKSLNLPAGSDVLLQAFTCEAVPLPVITAGLNPIYIDIEKETYSMDFEDLKKKITPNTKVLILQHTFGFTPQFRTQILELAKEKNLYILEDLAHGWNSDIFQKTIDASTTYLLSFGSSKAFSSVMGGAIITSDKMIADNLAHYEKQLSNPSALFLIRALLYKPLSVLIKSTYEVMIGKILHKMLNMFNVLIPVITPKEKNGEYDEMFAKAYPNALAILLLHQLKKYPETLRKRSETVKLYNEHFSPNKNSSQVTLSRYPLLVENRDAIMQKAAAKNIYLGKWYDQVVAPKEIDLAKMKYKLGSCPIAEEVSTKIINLPLTIKQVSITSIITTLKK